MHARLGMPQLSSAGSFAHIKQSAVPELYNFVKCTSRLCADWQLASSDLLFVQLWAIHSHCVPGAESCALHAVASMCTTACMHIHACGNLVGYQKP